MCDVPDNQYRKLDISRCSSRCAGGTDCNCYVRCTGAQSGGGASGDKRCRLFPGNDTADAWAAWVDADRELEDRVSFTLTVDVSSEQKKRRSVSEWESVMKRAISEALGYTVLPSDVSVALVWPASTLRVHAKVYSGASGKQVEASVKGAQLQDVVAVALGRSGPSEVTGFAVEGVKLEPAQQGWNQLPQCLPPITIEVVSAKTNRGLMGATISIYPEEDRTPGTETLTAETDRIGKAKLATEGRFYRVSMEKYASAVGFFDRSTCGSSQASCNFKVAISPELPGEELADEDCSFVGRGPNDPGFLFRAVLTWDAKPKDLDIWARSLDCARDIWQRYGCNPDAMDCQKLFRDETKLARHEHCVVRRSSSVKKVANQLPQWAHWFSRKVDHLNLDRSRPWSEKNYIKLDVDERNGYGPETVTFANVPPGTYQIVVDTYGGMDKDIRLGNPVVTLYFGKSSVPFICKIDSSCTRSSMMWNVVNIVVEEVKRNATSETYRIRLKDRLQSMEDIHLMDMTTDPHFSPRHGYNSRYLKNVCYGTCEPSNGGFSGPKGKPYDSCVERLDPCDIPDNEKTDCGYVGTRLDECDTDRCCWKEVHGKVDHRGYSAVPWCFRPK